MHKNGSGNSNNSKFIQIFVKLLKCKLQLSIAAVINSRIDCFEENFVVLYELKSSRMNHKIDVSYLLNRKLICCQDTMWNIDQYNTFPSECVCIIKYVAVHALLLCFPFTSEYRRLCSSQVK